MDFPFCQESKVSAYNPTSMKKHKKRYKKAHIFAIWAFIGLDSNGVLILLHVL